MHAEILLEFPALGIFDYDVERDHLELAGAAIHATDVPQLDNFLQTLDSQTWLNKPTRQLLAQLIRKLKEKPETGTLEYEADFHGAGLHWHRMQYTCVRDEQGRLTHIVGLSTDIQDERRQINSWKKLAREDTMTGLLNHEAVNGQIERAIREHDGGALLLLDIDDFKQINDTLGHMQGDLFLKRVAGAIRSLFRREDIIGRYGGDEFIIFLPGVKDVHFARQKADALIQSICSIRLPMLEQNACSIGIAIAPDENTALTTLFKQVDFALYEAKTFGKGHYVIIENGQAVHQELRDKGKLVPDMDDTQADQLTGALFLRLYRAKNLDEGINAALAYVGQHLDLSRAYIIERVENGPISRNTYEWCNKGIKPQIELFQNIDTRQTDKNFYANFAEGDLWFCPDITLLPEFLQGILKKQNVHSVLHWAFRHNGQIVGLIGFDECSNDRVWGSRYAQVLKRAGEVISEYLLAHRAKITSMEGLSERDLFTGLSNTSDNVYLFVSDMRRNFSKWSDNAVQYFGLPADYGERTLEVWLEHIHPEDRASYMEDINRVFSGKKNRHYSQYRATNRDGDYVWIECTGNVVTDKDGNGAFFVGLMTRLDHQSKFDPITKCLSIQQFYQGGPDEDCTLLLLGMDEFRRVINNFGYEVGNHVLAGLADILRGLVPDGLVYRMTGDEFLLVLPDGTEEAARDFFERALQTVQKAGLLREGWRRLSFSGGAVHYRPASHDKETTIRRLEHSMEHAKSLGSGSFAFFSREIEAKHTRVQYIKDALSRAIQHDFEGFELYYQPIHANQPDRRVFGVEALLRFRDPGLGMLSPREFIPILEKTRDIRSVGAWVMEQTIAQKARWNQKYPHLTVSFNVSYLQLTDEGFVDKLLQTVDKYGVDPHQVMVELTESCQAEYLDDLATMLERLMANGFGVALDDFGMEHSTFTLVQDLPVSYIKIDHSFVSTLTRGEEKLERVNRAIISSIAYLGRQLGLRVVVEGIENQAIDHAIGQMDVDLLQGYHYSRPVPAAEVEKLF